MATITSELEHRQSPLRRFVSEWYRGKGSAAAGRYQTDIRGKKLNLDHPELIRRKNGQVLLGQPVLDLLARIKDDAGYRTMLEGHFTGYDVRTSVDNPALWVLFGLALAAEIVESTGKKNGHIIHLGRDCYEKHETVLSIVAATLLQTGICGNGGGLINFGIVDGGTMKLTGGFAKAKSGRHGHWFYATVSHVADPQKRGGKIGVNGEVVTSQQLINRIFNRIVKGKLARLVANTDLETYVANVAPETYRDQQIALGAQVIRARTPVSPEVPDNKLLDGVKVAVATDDSPLVGTNIEVLRALGADVLVENTSWVIRDPNEGDSPAVKELKALAIRSERPVMFWDPDHDRVGFVARDEASGTAVNIDGSELLLLAAHNLATHNPFARKIRVVGDMRAFIPLDILCRSLQAKGYSIEAIPSEPGYSNIQVAIAKANADIGAERTSHFFTEPLTNRLWGAAEDLPGTQAGDNGPLNTVYFLGLQKYAWEGRSLPAQLAYIRAAYNVPRAVNREYKPAVDDSHGLAKVHVAREMCRIARENLGGLGENLAISEMQSGVRIYNCEAGAAVLIRYSNAGSGFTVSIEHLEGKEAEGEAILRLGAAITQLAVMATRERLASSPEPKDALLRAFEFSWNDLEPYKCEDASRLRQIVAEYRARF